MCPVMPPNKPKKKMRLVIPPTRSDYFCRSNLKMKQNIFSEKNNNKLADF